MTPKQQRFVEEYLIDLNATQAAIRAGYSAKGAAVEGVRLLTNAKVAKAVAAAQAARSDRTKIDADWVLRTLAEEKRADLADLYDEHGTLKPVSEWPMVFRTGIVVGVESLEEYEGAGKDRRLIGFTRKVKLSDRIKHLELIGKHVNVQAFRDQLGVSDPDGKSLLPTVIQLVGPDDAGKAPDPA
jgi:phage terminase small subunit